MTSPTADSISTLATQTVPELLAQMNEPAMYYLSLKTDEAKTEALARLEAAAERVMSARNGMLLATRRSMRDSMYEQVTAWQRRNRYRPEIVAIMNRVHNHYKV